MSEEDSLLTNFCAICHIQPPKYRCPRCSTRTCSLPCTRRHKLWSQCSGVRDPAAYLRRTELATESAFDRDFNFITSIERRLERASRDAENRGVVVDGRQGVREPGIVGLDEDELGQDDVMDGRKRKRAGPGAGNGIGHGFERGLAKGEAGFLKRAAEAGVRVIKAPKGMSRAKMNGSRWHTKQKCLQWTIEWVTDNGTRRMNCAETLTVAEAYDRAFPLTREERQLRTEESTSTSEPELASAQELAKESTQETKNNVEPDKNAEPTQSQSQTHQPPKSDIPVSESTLETAQQHVLPPNNHPTPAQGDTTQSTSELPSPSTEPPLPHRSVFFYIHRPRTATKRPVLAPVSPGMTLTSALQDRVVLEFPTIYVLQNPLMPGPDTSCATESEPGSFGKSASKQRFILEAEYLRARPDEAAAGAASAETAANEDGGEGGQLEDTDQALFGVGAVNIPDVDEGKMLEVLEKDLLGSS
ncbi:zinc finger HIT domain-containing protein [Aspergillus foveolatus]|uniref:zinc finger HIT domain-containing protein n=1 Tax=Aspergillus foveolatus TaxID=210207 RepID=UPI003CCE06F3